MAYAQTENALNLQLLQLLCHYPQPGLRSQPLARLFDVALAAQKRQRIVKRTHRIAVKGVACLIDK